MKPVLVLGTIAAYFGLLVLIAYLTSRKSNIASFFTANRRSPWYLVAFGMIGASLSGVTFISVPGEVGSGAFSYYQLVLGYIPGYLVIALILLPLYYKYNMVSIYSYLKTRFGNASYKTGSVFFLVSQTIGASFRLFLAVIVLQLAFFDSVGIPFWATGVVTIILIWLYTYKSGIKTIVWTDTLQTFFMLASVIISIVIIADSLHLSGLKLIKTVYEHPYSEMFNWDWRSKGFFWKQFFSGAFIAIVMTGLDQNMMQKNLTCRTLKDSQKNMFWFSLTLLPVNLLFMSLGVLLYVFAAEHGIALPSQTDQIFPMLAMNHFSLFAGIVFLIGIIAAAFSSADSAITALTTSFCVDILNKNVEEETQEIKRTKFWVHLGVSVVVVLVILGFKALNNDSVINSVFRMAGYTYGPLLGLYTFGLFTKIKPHDTWVPFIAVLSPIISYIVNINSEAWLGGYKFGFELLMLNGLITIAGLWFSSFFVPKTNTNNV